MVSLRKRSRTWFVQFNNNGRRQTVTLGTVSKKQAESCKLHIESLVDAQRLGLTVSSATQEWLSKVAVEVSERLQATGLINQVRALDSRVTIAELFDRHLEGKTIKENTRISWLQTRRWLVQFFGTERRVCDVTTGDMQDWRGFLAKTLSENTVRKRCGQAKQLFAYAQAHELIHSNPVAGLPVTVKENRARESFVSREAVEAVLKECPDQEWRTLITLSRFGGLRIPSESFLLKWDDIDWERGRMTVHSPKTERYAGHATRLVPLFPELLAELQAARDLAEDGAVHVLPRLRLMSRNVREPLRKMIMRTGRAPWPRLWHNMRASRQTELMADFPIHVVCTWLGNSVQVAARHYLQTTDDHFEQATNMQRKSSAEPSNT